MKSGWRLATVAALVSVTLTGCGAHVRSSSGCVTATSPDWVFSALLASGVVVLLSAVTWVLFLPGVIKGPPQPTRSGSRSRWGRFLLALPAFLVACNLIVGFATGSYREVWAQAQERYLTVALLGCFVLILGGLIVASRRHRGTGVWPAGRRAPWALFWVLPVIFSVALIGGVWAFTTMANSMITTSTLHC